jgi:RHS repeat-associated protein
VSSPGETAYAYNEDGQLASVTTAAGTTTYSYYSGYFPPGSGAYRGLLESVVDPLLGGEGTTYRYDPAGRVEFRDDDAADIRWTREYEAETGRLAAQIIEKDPDGTPVTLASFDPAYDYAGNVVSRVQSVATTDANEHRSGEWTYTYDLASRMTSAEGPDPSLPAGAPKEWDYAYDGMGNRVQMTVRDQGDPTPDVTYGYTTDGQGWPTALDVSGGSANDITYTWDEAGNLQVINVGGSASTSNDWTFTVDAIGRQTLAAHGTGGSPASVDYELDPFGRVATRTTMPGPVATDLAYEGTSEELAASTTGGNTTAFSSTPGGPLAQQVGTDGPSLFLTDLHGDVVGTISPSGTAPLTRTYYSPWGEAYTSGSPAVLGYQGDRTDPATTAVDMGARDYLPVLGRFTSRDPLFGNPAQPMSLNQYGYTFGNPVSSSDPSGLTCVDGPCGGFVDGNGDSSDDGDTSAESNEGGGSTGDVAEPPVAQPDMALMSYTYPWKGCLYGWCGTRGAHDHVVDAMKDELCPSFTFDPSARGLCAANLRFPGLQALRPDLVSFSTGEVWEVKTDKPGSIAAAIAQASRYVELLNANYGEGFRRGDMFEQFETNYRGHTLVVWSPRPGVALYHPDCHPQCNDPKLDSRTLINNIQRVIHWITWLPELILIKSPVKV